MATVARWGRWTSVGDRGAWGQEAVMGTTLLRGRQAWRPWGRRPRRGASAHRTRHETGKGDHGGERLRPALSPASAHAACGPRAPARPRWRQGSPAPGPATRAEMGQQGVIGWEVWLQPCHLPISLPAAMGRYGSVASVPASARGAIWAIQSQFPSSSRVDLLHTTHTAFNQEG